MEELKGKLVVYTALFGDYDDLQSPPKDTEGCDFICFTDQKINIPGWEMIFVPSQNNSSLMMNRQYKMLPHIHLEKYDLSLYIDSNIKITTNPKFLAEKYLTDGNLACPQHPERNCIYEEIAACVSAFKITPLEAIELTNKYQTLGFPREMGLTENNIIFRRHNDKDLVELMESWWKLLNEGPQRDQLILFFLLWQKNYKIIQTKETSRNNNRYFKYCLHKDYKKLPFFQRLKTVIHANSRRNILYYTIFKAFMLTASILKKRD